jgi:hypothetical protein
MEEFLSLEELTEVFARLYRKKKEGWQVVRKSAGNNLFDFIVKGPDILAEIIQDSPYILPIEGIISSLPRPWRPVGKAVILDEDPTKINFKSGPYGFRPLDKKTFKGLMRTAEMAHLGLPVERVIEHYDRVVREHARQRVIYHDETPTRLISIGSVGYRPSLMDISASQINLRAKLIDETMRMQRREYVV